MNITTLGREQVRDVDRRAIRDYGFSGLVLMENAGRGCVDVLCRLGIAGPVAICCGKGNNGGDGFVIARHLDLRGHVAKVFLACPAEELAGDALANYAILRHVGLPILPCRSAEELERLEAELSAADWIVDALLGTGAQGEPRPPLDAVIERINKAPGRKMAIDLPSGLDCDTGRPASRTVRADHTCTFVAAKNGFLAETAKPFLGTVHVLDIGVPPSLWRT